ncbi:hypothetical protein ACHAXT_006770 [Thalassiosira profunda]
MVGQSTVGVVQPQPTPSHPRQQTTAGHGNAAVHVQQSRGSSGMAKEEGKDIANLLFSPSHMDESNEISLLHSIFSPKFHARSARKKREGKSRVQHGGEERQEENRQCRSIFSPNPDTPGKDIPEDDVSAMSDEFGTINAILRGETAEPGAFTVEEIKKQEVQQEVGGEGRNDDGEMHVRFGVNEAYHPVGGGSLDDTTEAMLDKARLLASNSEEKGSPSGVQHPVKTPRESPTSDDDEFFTPASSAKSSSPPMARGLDVGRMSSGKGLPPVMEDEELKANEVVGGDGRSPEGANNGEFRTPKQDGVGWKMDDFSQSHDEDDEQFFSPLVSHSIHTPSKHKASPVFQNDSIFSLSISKDELSVTQVEVASPDVPVAAAPPTRKQSSSPGYSEAKEQLQSLLKTAKGLSPPEKIERAAQKAPRLTNATPQQQSVPSFAYRTSVRSTPQSPMSHLHSPSVSSLPRDALTVDFVKRCECVDTLEAILSLLSDDRNANHRGGKSWGKQLRYPSLVRLVEKRLQKLQKDSSLQLPEADWPVEVRPKMAARKQNPRYQGSAAGDKENVKPIAQKPSATRSRGIVLPTGSPSSAEGDSSLDMDLSQSLFTLDEESYYWKQGMDTVGDDGEKENAETRPNLDQQTGTQTEAAHLNGEMDSLFKELSEAKSRLRSATEELSQLKASSTNKEDAWQQQLAELETSQRRPPWTGGRIAESSFGASTKGQTMIRASCRTSWRKPGIKMQISRRTTTSSERSWATLRSIHESAQREVARLKVLIEKNASSETKDAGKMKRVVESAQLANKALAHALAVSEKDLAEANESKEKSAKDCDALRARSAELEDKTSFLSAKLKEMNKELKSSHVYIDQLYSDLQAQQSSPQLENQLVFDSKNKRVSMDAYIEVVEQTRHYKKEKEQEVAELKASVRRLRDTLDQIQKKPVASTRSSVAVGGKSMKTLQRLKQVSPENDENAAPSKPRAQQPPNNRGSEAVKQSQGKQLQQGKQLCRIAAVQAHGGRKALAESLKRARRFGGKTHNAGG